MIEKSNIVIDQNTDIESILSKITRDKISPEFIIVDLFCGAGGTTTGFEMAGGVAKVIACVNHDPIAIESHWANHPNVLHFEEDIRTLNLDNLIKIVNYYRGLYPEAKLILWASLECTNFSKAKGGQARDADSRTLADYLPRYIIAINPDYIQIENVVEFMAWGPLDENGKPVSKKNGIEWLRWRNEIDDLGYRNEWKELNSADFGSYTSRNRLFGCFAKHGFPIVWPTPTHAKNPTKGDLFDAPLKKWKAVKDVLDLQDEGKSIFNRKKDLSERTLERIYAGLIKFVANGDKTFLMKYFSGRPEGKVISVDSACGTIKTKDSHAIVSSTFLMKYNSMNKNGKYVAPGINDPCPTIACQNRLGVANINFLAKYYGSGNNIQSINEPAGTLTTKDRFSKVQTIWIDREYKTGCQSSIENPLGTILTVPKANIVQTKNLILNPSYQGNISDTEKPCPVIVARQDKAPLQLLQICQSDYCIPIYENDSEVMIKIKICMAEFGISDIKTRMLKVSELLPIQGFPKNYILKGNQTDQKKFIGNSVEPNVPKVWILAFSNKFTQLKKAA